MAFIDWLRGLVTPAESADLGRELGASVYWNPFANAYWTDSLSKDDAYAVATYQSCVELIARVIGTSPTKLKKYSDATGYVQDEAHPLADLFGGAANSDGILWGLVVTDLVRNAANESDGYAWIKRNGASIELYSLPSCIVKPYRSAELGLYYIIFDPQTRKPKYRVPPYEIIHLRGTNNNGYGGKSVLQTAGTAIGLARDAQEFGHKFYLQGTNLGGVIETTQKLNDDGMKTLVQSMKSGGALQSGKASAFKIGILPFGTKYTPFQTNLSDGQFEETRRYQDLQLARLFYIPPAVLGIIESGDKNTEQQALNFHKYCLGPWFSSLEKELEAKLLTSNERKTYRIRFNVDAILRADYMTRVDGFCKLRNSDPAILGPFKFFPEASFAALPFE